MVGGGQVAMRGLLVQTFIAVLEALDDEPKWTSVTLEPNVDSEKVDILWRFRGGTKAVQVKSTQNAFSRADIQRWAAELEAWKQADGYELVLVGTPESPAAARIRKAGGVAVPQAKNLNLAAFQAEAAHRLEKFLKGNGLPTGDANSRELLVDALSGRLASYSTQGRPMARDRLVKLLKSWLPQTPQSVMAGTGGDRVQLVRIFVSSPDDVAAERDVARQVIECINRTDGQRGGYRLELFRPDQHVVPQIGPGRRRVIDSQTPPYEIYLGIMSARFGDQTGQEGSGTEEEFRTALRRWKREEKPWILFCFDVGPKSFSKSQEARDFAKVCEFREELESQGVVCGYTGVRGSVESFYELLDAHLRRIASSLVAPRGVGKEPRIRQAPGHAAKCGNSGRRRSGPPAIPPQYLQGLQERTADVDLLGLKLQQGQTIKLHNVYVPLTTTAEQGPKKTGRGGQSPGKRRIQLPLDLLGRHSLYVSGQPGCGKSTFCRWVAWLACQGRMPDAQIEPPEGYREKFPSCLTGRLPLLVRLRDFWNYLPQTPGSQEMTERELEGSLARWIETTQQGGLAWPCVAAHLQRGSMLLILDGVDEVPLTHGDAKHPCRPRAMLLSALPAALRQWTAAGNRVILTSRLYGLSQQEVGRLPLRHAPLLDLDAETRRLLVRRWFHCLIDPASRADEVARQMLDHIERRGDIVPLSANPMLLTAMCIIYQQGHRLPQNRCELYDRIVDNVLFNRFPEDRAIIDPVRNRLAVVAYGMHTGEGVGEDRLTPQAEATCAEVDRMIQTYQDQSPWTEPSYTTAVAAREQLLAHTGLLLPQGQQRCGFYHLTFQDFLAAQRLLDVHGDDLLVHFCRRGAVPEWRSALGFAYGSLLAKHSSPQRGIALLGGLIESLSEKTLEASLVAADCLETLLKRGLRLKPELEERFRLYCQSAIDRQVPIRARIDLGDALGLLGDPRIDSRRSDYWATIPAGRFLMGAQSWDPKKPNYDKDASRNEAPVHEVYLSAFRLARYPVTVGEYRQFVEDRGYEDERWWQAGGLNEFAQPDGWEEQLQYLLRPVVGISWWEAEAYCAWAGHHLPTEAEWERAARAAEGREYPWGSDEPDGSRVNFASHVGHPTPVGIYPLGSTPDGIFDMGGNVWEWCADGYGKYCADSVRNPRGLKEAADRVIRGGSWWDVAGDCRAAYRDGIEPQYRFVNLGFRAAAVGSRELGVGDLEKGLG